MAWLAVVAGIGSFIVVLGLLTLLRMRTGKNIEFKGTDVALALVPVALWLLLTGQLREFSFGDIKVVWAIEQASSAKVENEVTRVTELPIEHVQMAMKGRLDEIPGLSERKPQGLIFTIGDNRYSGQAINEYLHTLAKLPFFRYVVLNGRDARFWGMFDVRQLVGVLDQPGSELNYGALAKWLNTGAADQLRRLPGLVPKEIALTQKTDRRRALLLMDSLDVETLPVVDGEGRFVGVAERSRLSASMLIDIVDKLEKGR